MNRWGWMVLALVAVGPVAAGCSTSSTSEDEVGQGEGEIQVEKRTAVELKGDVLAARDNARELRQHAQRLVNNEAPGQAPKALEELGQVTAKTRDAIIRLRQKLENPQAAPGTRFARVPEPELRRVIDQLADVGDAYLEKLGQEIPELAAKIRDGRPTTEVERDAIVIHVLDALHNLNFALRTINEWIAEADNTALPRCAETNRWGSFPAGGNCTIWGCFPRGGGCNLFGCFKEGGQCNLHSCTNEIEPGDLLCRPR